ATGKLRQLRNLIGTWKIDRDAAKEVDGILSKLGVYDSLFQFDN
ncbi:16002_t:CDS:1, partial [Funneliformis caledonium]